MHKVVFQIDYSAYPMIKDLTELQNQSEYTNFAKRLPAALRKRSIDPHFQPLMSSIEADFWPDVYGIDVVCLTKQEMQGSSVLWHDR